MKRQRGRHTSCGERYTPASNGMSGSLTASELQVDEKLVASVNGALVLATILAPLLSAELVAAPCSALGKVLPPVGTAVAQSVRSVADACSKLRVQKQMLFALLHGALTYFTGDLIAQLAMSGSSSKRADQAGQPVEGEGERTKRGGPPDTPSRNFGTFEWTMCTCGYELQ